MVNGASIGVGCKPCTTASNCPDKSGCPADMCPDFLIKRHDTVPSFKVSVDDCDGPLDLSDPNYVLEVNMWAKGKLKTAINESDTYFSLADNIGFEQIMVGDIIILDRARLTEYMLVNAFDETNSLVQVQRAYSGTQASSWKKGTALRIFRIMGAIGSIEISLENILQVDGTTATDQVVDTSLVYAWDSKDTCLSGCYWLEFKLLKMATVDQLRIQSSPIIPSFTLSTYTSDDFGCGLGVGVETVRRFPSNSEGFLIKIVDSPTAE